MNISDKLKQARLNAGMTQEFAAQQLNISRQTMSNWENGRSCPDIANVLKLSELYRISLDTLLKEPDAAQTQEVHFLKRHWYTFYHCAVATLPLASLCSYFGFPPLALLLRICGLLLFSLPRLLFHRLFGGGLKNVLLGILGWVIMLFYFHQSQRTLLLSALHLCGIFLVVYSINREFLSQKRTTSWVVVGIILLSQLIMLFDSASTAGAFSAADPFGHRYRVDEILYTTDTSSDVPIVELGAISSGGILYLTDDTLDQVRIGEFTYVEPAPGQQEAALKGIWQPVPKDDADALYRLTVDQNDRVVLSHSVAEQLQWQYTLARVDTINCTVSTFGMTTSIRLEWFENGTFHGDLSQLDKADVYRSGKLSLSSDDPSITEYPLYEEYFHDGVSETAQYSLSPEDSLLKLQARYDSGEQYAIYQIPWQNGAYIFFINYSN